MNSRAQGGIRKRRSSPVSFAPADRLRDGRQLLVAALAVATIITAAYWPVLSVQAVSLDDHLFVGTNPLVTAPGLPSAKRFFVEVLRPSTVRGYYVPLTMTSLMLDYAAGGRPTELKAFHRTNLALHVLSSVLILLICYRLFGAIVPATIAALLFGLHPLTVEPVAWIAERKTMLATPFALASIACYLEYCRQRSSRWMTGCALFFALGLLSKPTVTMLPLLLLVLDWWPLSRVGIATVIEKWPLFLLSLISGVITIASNQTALGVGTGARADLLIWPLRIGYLLAFYVGKVVWPAHLSCLYDEPEPFNFSNPIVVLSATTAAALAMGLVLVVRRTRAPLAGWLFFVFAIAPALGVVKNRWWPAADKYVYFPAFGLAMILAWALSAAWSSRNKLGGAPRWALLGGVLALIGAEAVGARRTIAHWKDSLTLWQHIVEVAPRSSQARTFYGMELEVASRPDAALDQFKLAVALKLTSADPILDLGSNLLKRGQADEAIRWFHEADQLFPNNPFVAYCLGRAAWTTGRLEEAEAWLRRAMALQPEDAYGRRVLIANARGLLGIVVVQRGRLQEGVSILRDVVASDSTDARPRLALATALLLLGGHDAEAAQQLRAVIATKPSSASPYNSLAWLLATSSSGSLRNPEEAMSLADQAMALSSGSDPNVLDTRGAALAAAGHFALAIESANSALEQAARAHADSLAPEIRGRIALYRRGVPYVAPALTSPRQPVR